jgi:hypothetical protein
VEVTVVYTSTSLIVQKVPTTIIELVYPFHPLHSSTPLLRGSNWSFGIPWSSQTDRPREMTHSRCNFGADFQQLYHRAHDLLRDDRGIYHNNRYRVILYDRQCRLDCGNLYASVLLLKFRYTNFVPDVTETSTIELTSAYTITETLEPPTTKATVFVSSFPYHLIIFPRRMPWLLRPCDLEDEPTSNIQLLYTFLGSRC